MKGERMRSALPPTQLRNWSRGHTGCWLLTPARAIGATSVRVFRGHSEPRSSAGSVHPYSHIIAGVSARARRPVKRNLPAEGTFKLKLGPRHKVSLCTLSYRLIFAGTVSFETSPACGR